MSINGGPINGAAINGAYGGGTGGAAGQATMPLTLVVFDNDIAKLPLRLVVGEHAGRASATVSIVVRATGRATTPITMRVIGRGQAGVGIAINVYDPAAFTASGAFSCRIVMGGVDISTRLTGLVSVEADEGAARLADFTFAPAAGVVLPAAWVGQPVTIDYVQAGCLWRLFTGIVDEPVLDVVAGTVTMRCTDNIQRIMDAASRDQIDALTPGGAWSQFLFDIDHLGWDYLQDRALTLCGSLDLSPTGVPRLTSWLASVATRTFTADDILDQTPRVEMAQASALTNRVEISFQARLPLLRQASVPFAWSYGGEGALMFSEGRPFYAPEYEVVRDALDGIGEGWQVNGLYVEHIVVDPGRVRAVSGEMVNRWVQDMTQTYAMTVSAQSSRSMYGDLTDKRSANLSYSYDETAWVDDGRTVQETTPDTTPEMEIETALKTLLLMARHDIRASHRNHRISFSVGLDPRLDVAHAYRIDASGVAATGKAASVAHRLDLDAGTATSEVALAISSSGYSGAQTADALSPPTAPVAAADPVLQPPNLVTQVVKVPISLVYGATIPAPDWDLDGWSAQMIGSISGSAPTYDSWMSFDSKGIVKSGSTVNKTVRVITSISWAAARAEFKVSLPAIDATYIDHVEPQVSADYTIDIPEDEFTLTF